jgi:hypothetical protein
MASLAYDIYKSASARLTRPVGLMAMTLAAHSMQAFGDEFVPKAREGEFPLALMAKVY